MICDTILGNILDVGVSEHLLILILYHSKNDTAFVKQFEDIVRNCHLSIFNKIDSFLTSGGILMTVNIFSMKNRY